MKLKFLLLALTICCVQQNTFGQTNSKFYLHANGVTCMCPNANVGETGTVNGVKYTKRTKVQITYENASTTCTSGITDMSGLFSTQSNFNGNISSWDVSSVTNMSSMFKEANSFNQPIGNWDVSSVTNMSSMFVRATSFRQLISNWDVGNVTRMDSMFFGASRFGGPLNWDVSKVTTMSNMFGEASLFNSPLNWDVSNVTNMYRMFSDAESFNQPIGNWNVSSVTNVIDMFSGKTSFNRDLSKWCMKNITSEPSSFSGGSLPITYKPVWGKCPDNPSILNNPNFYLHINGVTCMCPNAIIGEKGLLKGTFYTKRTREQITTENASTTCTSNIKDMSGLFAGKSTFNENIIRWDVSDVTNMSTMFNYATNFNQPIGNWDVSNVTDMYQMFSVARAFNQPIGTWNVSKVTDMSNMFGSAVLFNQDISNWCVKNITIEPLNFSINVRLTPAYKPKWGAECTVLSNEDFAWLSNEISVYPNPFTSYLKITIPDNVQVKQVQVLNNIGQTVYTAIGPELKLDHLQTGIYFVKITTDKGVVNEKIIKN